MLKIPQLLEIQDESPYTYEAFVRVIAAINQLSAQTGVDAAPAPQTATGAAVPAGGTTKALPPPAAPASISVTATRGTFNAAIGASPGAAPGAQYFLEAASDTVFSAGGTTVFPLGNSLNASIALGNVTRYFRARAKYPTSDYSAYIYLGTQANPTAVNGGQVGLGTDTSGNLDNVPDGTTYQRPLATALTTGQVDLGKAGVINKITDNITDGTGSPLTGGKRGFVALDSNNRMADTFREVPLNTFYTISSGLGLTQSGTTTTISIAAGVVQFGSGTVSYNSGSVDPGAYGTYFVYFDDPTYAGGGVTYQASTSFANITANKARIYLGKITTAAGGGGSGGGGGGGSGGGGHLLQ